MLNLCMHTLCVLEQDVCDQDWQPESIPEDFIRETVNRRVSRFDRAIYTIGGGGGQYL